MAWRRAEFFSFFPKLYGVCSSGNVRCTSSFHRTVGVVCVVTVAATPEVLVQARCLQNPTSRYVSSHPRRRRLRLKEWVKHTKHQGLLPLSLTRKPVLKDCEALHARAHSLVHTLPESLQQEHGASLCDTTMSPMINAKHEQRV